MRATAETRRIEEGSPACVLPYLADRRLPWAEDPGSPAGVVELMRAIEQAGASLTAVPRYDLQGIVRSLFGVSAGMVTMGGVGEITVVGAGVIGLSIAHELATRGHRVSIVADGSAAESVSAVAAAIWFPHDVGNSASVLDSAQATYLRLRQLALHAHTGVRMRSGTVLVRSADADLSWTRAVPEAELLDAIGLPSGIVAPGAISGVRCAVPLAVTDIYLGWLRTAVQDLGVPVRTAEVQSIERVFDEDEPDAIVVAAGLRSAALLGDDDETYPIRGQIVRLANPGLTEWVTDDDNPDGLTYVVPRDGDVVCGGTGERGSLDKSVNPDVEKAILRRARALVPALAGQPILSRAVGLRPARPTVRLEAVTGYDRPVFSCYGHGGAGFTLSWGDAERIAEMVGPA